MSSASTVDENTNGAALLPPDEKFWQRYSRHHEFSLSGVGSVVLHGLFLGVLALGYLLLTQSRQGETHRPVSMDVVQLEGPGIGLEGGGGGGEPGPKGALNQGETENVFGTPTPDPNKNNLAKDDPKFEKVTDDPPVMIPEGPDSEPDLAAASFKEIAREADDVVRKAMKREATALATKGTPEGGKTVGNQGSGGTGAGPGKGNKSGPGGGTGGAGRKMTRQEIFAQRWRFDLKGTPREHVDKLVAAGVIIVVQDPRGQFLALHDLKRRPVDLTPIDMEKYKDAVYWINSSLQSVSGLGQELRLPFPLRFAVMLLPKDREEKMVAAEAAYARNQGRPTNTIRETWFDFQPRAGSLEPLVISQK